MLQSPEKSNWLRLASSSNPEDRQLAMELAPAIQDQIQDELLILFAEGPAFSIAQRIFELLDEEHRSLIMELEGGKVAPRVRPHHNLAAFRAAEERAEKLALLRQTSEGRNFFAHKLLYVKYYWEYSGRKMRASRDNMEELFHRAKALDPLAGTEEDA